MTSSDQSDFERRIRSALVEAYETGFTDGVQAVRSATVAMPEDWMERAHRLAFDEGRQP
jgi:hypothetical protein